MKTVCSLLCDGIPFPERDDDYVIKILQCKNTFCKKNNSKALKDRRDFLIFSSRVSLIVAISSAADLELIRAEALLTLLTMTTKPDPFSALKYTLQKHYWISNTNIFPFCFPFHLRLCLQFNGVL